MKAGEIREVLTQLSDVEHLLYTPMQRTVVLRDRAHHCLEALVDTPPNSYWTMIGDPTFENDSMCRHRKFYTVRFELRFRDPQPVLDLAKFKATQKRRWARYRRH